MKIFIILSEFRVNVNAKDIDLTDVIITHNHQKIQTRFSLSFLDVNMFNEEKIVG